MNGKGLTPTLKLEFLTAAIFGRNGNTEKEYIDSAIDLAYRDLSRTMHGYSKSLESQLHDNLKDKIKSFIEDLRSNTHTQVEFNDTHSDVCNDLINLFNAATHPKNSKLHYGQAQKWVNMTLKYLLTLTLSCPSLSNIENNYQYFHVPIDSLILRDLKVTQTISWSRIDKDQYLEYQAMFKKQYPNEIPIVREFRVWNDA